MHVNVGFDLSPYGKSTERQRWRTSLVLRRVCGPEEEQVGGGRREVCTPAAIRMSTQKTTEGEQSLPKQHEDMVSCTEHNTTYIITLPQSLTAQQKENRTYTTYMRKTAT
jgi:hypothetical protein